MSALWYIDEAGTAHPLMVGPRGPVGPSAYEVWLAAGNTGTVEDYHESLRGEPGPGAIPTHQTVLIDGDATLPIDRTVLTLRASAPAVLTVPDAPDGTVITVHVVEGWQHITWAPGITVTGATDTSETWVVLVRAEGAWQALVSGESEAPAVPDTGMIDINPLINATDWYNWGDPFVRRIGPQVFLYLSLYTRATWQYGDSSPVLVLPVGYRPDTPHPSATVPIPLMKPNAGGLITCNLSVSGQVGAARGSVPISDGGSLFGYVTYLTSDPWPA